MSVRTVLCTGRRWHSALPVLRALKHGHPVVVCGGGSLVKDADDGRTLRAVAMEHGTARTAVRLMRQSGLVPMLLYDRPLGTADLMLAESDRASAERLPYAREGARAWAWYLGEYPDTDERPLACYAVDETRRIGQGLLHVRAGLGESAITNALALSRYGTLQSALEAHDPGATKWLALAWLLGEWGLSPEQVVAIGDDVNDLPMLRAAGLSFAMGNAPDDVKAEADAVTASNDENGVVEALSGVFGL
jgi:hydroxymethylpyrimidine pyrophosphatase-like HAD family hydrolase